MLKNMVLTDGINEFSAQGIDENGFHLALSTHISEERTDVAEVFVDVKTAKSVVAMLQEAIEHSERIGGD